MDEFKELDEELKKLEDEYSATGADDLHELILPTATDYWKRRVDDEKSTWTKLLEAKDQEKSAVEQKLSKAEAEIKSLHEKIRAFDKQLAEELAQWQEKFRLKEIEFEVSRERMNFIDRIKDLEREKVSLQEEISKTKKESEEKLNVIEATHKKEIEELISSQDALVENLSSIEKEMQIVETDLQNYREKNRLQEENIVVLKQEKDTAEKDRVALKTDLEEMALDSERRILDIYRHMDSVISYYSEMLRQHVGTLMGIVALFYRN